MKKLSIVVSLPGDNKYLTEQAAAAEATALRLGVDLTLINAHSDAVAQGQQLLEIIQSPPSSRRHAIIMEPANELGLPRVADAAVEAGIGWVISNARVDYLEALRKRSKAPAFSISQDHEEIGRTQGRQMGALLPQGGTVLYLRGPASNYLASQRMQGLESTVPRNIQLKALKIQWTEESCYQSISSWIRLSTMRAGDLRLIVSQNTDFVAGARKAFQEQTSGDQQTKWLSVPCIAAGTRNQTKSIVDKGILAAAVITSLTMDTALEMLAKALHTGVQPPEHTVVESHSYPSLENLESRRAPKLSSAATK
jgi:ABC-type sugar transport system substrate-binding protein